MHRPRGFRQAGFDTFDLFLMWGFALLVLVTSVIVYWCGPTGQTNSSWHWSQSRYQLLDKVVDCDQCDAAAPL